MAKSYGKFPTRTPRKTAKPSKPPTAKAIKYNIRGKDDAPMTITEHGQGVYQMTKEIQQLTHLRVAKSTTYIHYIDEDGKPAGIGKSEVDIYPYRSAADEHGVK